MNTATNRPRRGGFRGRKPQSRSSNSSHTKGAPSSSHARTQSGGFNRGGNKFNSGGQGKTFRKPFGNSSGRFSNNRFGGRRSGKKVKPVFNPSHFINTNPKSVEEVRFAPVNTFQTFGLDAQLEKNVAQIGLETPTPIQDQVIPEILKGRDTVGLAETGTGKTAAFLVPLIHKTRRNMRRKTLILAPTRELALQIDTEFRKLSQGMRMFSTICVGGMPIGPQMRNLRRENQFIIGTPGRVLDLLNRKCLDAGAITSVVLDEADRMLDMGFIRDMRTILSAIPKERETLFFSATMNDETRALVHDFLRDPVVISVKKKETTDSIEQNIMPYEEHHKFDLLCELLGQKEFSRVIVFGAMKHSVERLAKQLETCGVKAESIHGNKSHGQRQRALTNFKQGKAQVLVATDVAARGIHVDDVSHVINYDLPNTFEDYVHRIGRTGRGSKRGKALTFVPKAMTR